MLISRYIDMFLYKLPKGAEYTSEDYIQGIIEIDNDILQFWIHKRGCVSSNYGLFDNGKDTKIVYKKGFITVNKPNKFIVYKDNNQNIYLRHYKNKKESVIAGLSNNFAPIKFTDKLFSSMKLKKIISYTKKEASIICQKIKNQDPKKSRPI